MKKTLSTIKALVLCSLLLPSLVFAQGSLTPPGVPAPTMKTLAQIEPRTPISALPFYITNSGSYYLTASLSAVPGVNGIYIATNNVTLDLNGFSLIGDANASAAVMSFNSYKNISILNGTLLNWTGGGVALSLCNNVSVRNLRLDNNSVNVLQVGSYAMISDCVLTGNGGGIAAGNFSQVRNCNCRANGGTGISVGFLSIVSSCTTSLNGSTEISVAGNTIVTDCMVASQGQEGILLTSNCQVRNNVANGWGPGTSGSAFHATSTGNRFEGNHAIGAGYGFKIDAGSNLLLRNSALGCGFNYSIAAGNFTGTIVTNQAAMNAATNANANISMP
jgi:hypothetical protein